MFNAVLVSACLWILSVTATASTLPMRHHINNVKQYNEVTGLNCGPASLESVFNYFGPDINQREIADVARTSSIGTYVFDIVRAAQFSYLSQAQGQFFPHDVPAAGYTQRRLGYAAFGHSQATPWLDGLKALVAQDLPPILLMLYTPEPNSGGHYRVMVGYDDDLQQAYFIDPWGRDLNRFVNPDGTVTWSYQDLLTAWNYPEYGSDNPFFAAVISPWQVSLSIDGIVQAGNTISVTADVTYPCPTPFDCSQYPATNANIELSMPAGMNVIGGIASVDIGALPAGGTSKTTWQVSIDHVSLGAAISVSASGEISGVLPAAAWTGGEVNYPSYTFTDRIGGNAVWVLK